MTMNRNHKLTLVDKTQADGAETLGNAGFENLPNHQIQIEVSAQPAAGSLKIEFRTPGASQYTEPEDSPVDMTAINKAVCFRLNNVFADSFKVTPTDFDAAKTYSVIIISNE